MRNKTLTSITQPTFHKIWSGLGCAYNMGSEDIVVQMGF